jgi:hypothetical protein
VIEFALAGITATVLTEGVKFLYGQASDLLKEWRQRRQDERRDSADDPATRSTGGDVPNAALPSGLFSGEPQLTRPDWKVIEEHEQIMDDVLILPALVRIANGRDADPDDAVQIEAAEALRVLLEDIYHTRITLVGESRREPSGTPLVRGEAEAESVAGLLAGVAAGTIGAGTVEGRVRTKDVKGGGTAAGVKADRIG